MNMPGLQAGSHELGDFPRLLACAASEAERAEHIARWVLDEFDAYYYEARQMPALAQRAFEQRDYATTVELSLRRLNLYSLSMNTLSERLREACPRVLEDQQLWRDVDRVYSALIAERYESDIAYAYLHSVWRRLRRGEWKPVDYRFMENAGTTEFPDEVCCGFPGGARLEAEVVERILDIPNFSVPWRDRAGDAALVAERVNRTLGLDGSDPRAIQGIEMINAGFFRNRGAYLVGRILRRHAKVAPLLLSLENSAEGIHVDAVMTSEADGHNIFSSTLANFHVTNKRYHELAAFLNTVMPARPLGLHYSTIGFNHVGKVAVMRELSEELASTGEVFNTAPGFRGTVAIGFSAPSSRYNLKVLRDKPTDGYKWGVYPGREAVLRKYSLVHEINRTGSMLDNIIYYNLSMDRSWFAPELLDELLRDASETLSLQGDTVLFRYLIVQVRVTPLPVFLEQCSEEEAVRAVINLGDCIKNNAAGNVFNQDLDTRNYGVSRYLKVYLFDYDAVERLTDIKVYSNEDRCDGEEDVPDWYFEEATVLLPEEIEANLEFPDRRLRRLFREVHGDLLTVEYWERMQRDLRAGRVPGLVIYPQERRLRR